MVATEVKIAGKMLFNLNGGDPSQVEAASEATLVSRIREKLQMGADVWTRFSQRLVLGLRNYNHIYYYTYQ